MGFQAGDGGNVTAGGGLPGPRLIVGRVGALAAALGIGAAMFAIPGLAAADTGGSGGASGSTSSSGSPSSGSRGPAHRPSRTAAKPSASATAGIPGAGAAEAAAGRAAGTGRQTGPAAQVPTEHPNPVVPESDTRRSARAGSQARAAAGASPVAKSVQTPTVAPSAATPAASLPTTSAAAVPSASAAAVGGSSGNAGASAVAITSAPVGQPSIAAAATSPTPFGGASAGAPVAQLAQKIDAQTQATVRRIFNTLINWTSTLPVNELTSWFEGGLLMVRKSLFNQTAGVHSVQTANSLTLVTGKIDVVDPEGDAWNVELAGDPSHGTVVLGKTSQTNGIGSTKYTYTPGAGYAGADQFVVKVSPTEPVTNVLHPSGLLNTRYYTVTVGDAAETAKDSFNAEGADPKDTPDTHLYLSSAAATITVKKQGLVNPKYAVTVTLPAGTAAKSFAWMDTRGNIGSIPVDTMLGEDWDAYAKKAAENGGKPLLSFKYSDQGADKAVFIDVAAVTKNADGSYTLSGDLKDGVPAQDGRVDTWDFTGHKYKAAFDNFLSAADLDNCKSGQVCATVSTVGVLGTTTLSSSAFTQTGGHDYPLPKPGDASALQTSPGSMGPGTITGVGAGEGNGTEIVGNTGYPAVEMTAMIPWGTDGSFIAATNLSQAETGQGNGIYLFSAQAPKGGQPSWTKTELVGNTWNAAVNVMTPYDQIKTDANGVPIPTSYTGVPVTGVQLTATSNLTLAVTDGADPSSLIGQAITGDGIAPGTVITGYVSSDITGITYSVSNPINPSSKSIRVTLPDKPTVQPGLIVGLSDGSVYYWNGTVGTKATAVGPIVNGIETTVIGNVDSPVSVAIAPDGKVFALGDNLTIIDGTTNDIVATLPVDWAKGKTFPNVVVSPDGFYAYATAALPNDTAGIAVIDTSTNAITATITLPDQATAQAVAISPDSSFGYIANGANYGGAPSVYQFSLGSETVDGNVVTTFTLGANIVLPDGSYPAGLAFSADGSTLYASSATNGAISVIDTASNTISQTISVAGNPAALAVSPDGGSLFVMEPANYNGNYISVVDTSTNTVSTTIYCGNGPSAVAFNPNPGLPYAYVTNSNDSTVTVIDTQTMSVVGTFATGAGDDDTLGIAVAHDGLHVYFANYDGGGDDYGTVPVYQVATPVEHGWAQLQASAGWGDDVAVNNIVALPNNLGFVVGLSDGTLATWDNPILADGTIVPAADVPPGCSNGSPGGCWTIVPDNPLTSVQAIMPNGQNGGFVAMGTALGGGWIQGFNGSGVGGQAYTDSTPTTLIPYDGTTLIGSIGSAPVVADVATGEISAPSYASQLPDLTASTAGCATSYNAGGGAGCAGYVLTVQQAAGNPIKIGQTLYGGPGLSAGTVIIKQISDGSGNLCSDSCNGGAAGVYLVDTSQIVAPGTPMSASDGTGYVVGFSNGVVAGWNNGLGQLAPEGWVAAETTMLPWRDGFVVGLNNGAVMYWSPSNNPAGSQPFTPDNAPSMALTYPGSTIASQLPQAPGWSQLQGWTQECGCIGWGGQAVTSLVQMGDGFAVGLTAPNDSSNGMVQMFTGFGAGSASSAFGYLQTTTTTTTGQSTTGQTTTTSVTALPRINAFTEIASDTALPGPSGVVGSVQQMVPINQFVQDSAGNWWNASSLVVGLTDNGIYTWAGSNLPGKSTTGSTTWNQQQAPSPLPGQLDLASLKAAWKLATTGKGPSGAFGDKGAVGGADDQVFGSQVNQAACGSVSSCASSGDYQTFTFNHPFGDKGVIYKLGSGSLTADLTMSAAGYGYLFIPSGVWDKFEPDNYSAGLVMGVQAGPEVKLDLPNSVTIKETLKGSDSFTDTQDTEVGVFGETVGIDVALTGALTLADKDFPKDGLKLAWAYYTPGLMFTWNTNGNRNSLGMQYSAFSDGGYLSPDDMTKYIDPSGEVALTATATPYASVSYGLFTTSPIDLSIFKLSLGYQNPISATVTAPLNDLSAVAMSLSSQGFLTASAGFIPQITSDLTWKGKYQLYSVQG